MTKEKLNKIRQRIDIIDDELLKLLEKRLALGEEIAKLKSEMGWEELTDEKREEEILRRLKKNVQHPILKQYLNEIFQLIMEMNKEIRRKQFIDKNIK